MRYFIYFWGVCVLIWNITLFLNPNHEEVSNFLFNSAFALLYLIGAFIAAKKALSARPGGDFKKSMVPIAIALTSWSVALFIWTYLNIYSGIAVPYPSLSDFFYIIFHPLAFTFFYYLTKSLSIEISKKLIVEGVFLFFVVFGLIFFFVTQTSLGPDVSFGAKVFNILYPFFDSIMIAFSLTILRTEKGVSSYPNLLIIIFGFISLAMADTIFAYKSSDGTYWNGGIADSFFATAGFMISLFLTTYNESPETT